MYIIDTHVHAFADKIVKRAMDALLVNSITSPETDGTVAQTIEKMHEWNIASAVILPIATKPTQQTIVNNWAYQLQATKPNLVCCGSVHPDAADIYDELKRIKELGLKGVKLHPDYQDFFVDEERMIPVYKKCAELDLPIVFHAGYDPLSPQVTHATPSAFARVFDRVPELTAVLAHMGGLLQWGMVEEYLVGKYENVYFDTAMVAKFIPIDQFKRMIKNHGTDKILFASDCPWDNPLNEKDIIKSLGLSIEQQEQIFHKNAEKIFKIPSKTE